MYWDRAENIYYLKYQNKCQWSFPVALVSSTREQKPGSWGTEWIPKPGKKPGNRSPVKRSHDHCGHRAALGLGLPKHCGGGLVTPLSHLVLFCSPFSVLALWYIINDGMITICEGCGRFSLSYSWTSIKTVSLHILSQLPTSLKKYHHQLPFPCHITICLVLSLTLYYKPTVFQILHKHINRHTQFWKCWAKLE